MNRNQHSTALAAALDLRARKGLSFTELSRRTGVSAGDVVASLYGLLLARRASDFVGLTVVDMDPTPRNALTLRGPSSTSCRCRPTRQPRTWRAWRKLVCRLLRSG